MFFVIRAVKLGRFW